MRSGLGTGLLALLASSLCLSLLFWKGEEALKQSLHGSLITYAKAAASLVDGDAHRTITRPEQENTPAYKNAVEPLKRILKANPDIRFLYTMVLSGDKPHIILDATPPGDIDRDGVEDHSPIMEPYDTPAPALNATFLTGKAQADSEPIKDQWGTYLSAYAPFFDSQGRQAGIVGIDLRIDKYNAQLAVIRSAFYGGLTAALFLSILFGLIAGLTEKRLCMAEEAQTRTVQHLKQTKAEHQKAEQDYHMLFEQLPVGFALHEMINDAQGAPIDYRFIVVNNAFERLTGLKSGNIIGRTAKEVMPEIENHWIESFDQVVKTGKPVEFENFSLSLGKHYHVTSYRSGPNQFVVLFMDITERKLLEEEKQRTQQQLQNVQKLESLGLLAGGVAHDFSNLLMAILGNIDMILLDTSRDPSIAANISQVKMITLQAADLCKQLLAYSGRGKFLITNVDLSVMVREMSKLLEVSVSKKAALQYQLETSLPSAKADVTQLRQVLMNLVINASDAIGDNDGVIRISTGVMVCDNACLQEVQPKDNMQPGEYVYIEVSDTGCGMSPDVLEKIFDPFFTTKFTGRGIGLAAVIGIVRGHNGGIIVKSTPGHGTTFRLILPPSRESAAAPAPAKEMDSWKGSGVFLLIDDEAAVRAISAKILKRLGFTVIAASNGREGVELFRQHAHELACVLVDLTMPVMDGAAAFEEMTKIRPDIPVILCSGYNPKEIDEKYLNLGFAGFIQKPYEITDLIQILRRVLKT